VLVGFIPYFKGRTPTVGNWIAALKRLPYWAQHGMDEAYWQSRTR